ncbi:MAG: DUF3800 domain-containing protein [Patescibacteria group bacterium]
MLTKLYCYVDETGQDTKGELFLVAVVLKDISELEVLEKKLEGIEEITGKRQSKWKKTTKKVKQKYLDELVQVKELRKSIFYATYQASKEYSKLTSFTIAKAVLAKETTNYTVTVIIDGLNDKERDVVRGELKKLKIRYRKIRGMKDEQNIFLRLSDAMAGFLREAYENEKYALQFIKRFKKTSIVIEV